MSAYHHNCEMKALTSQQFNEAIGQFKDVLFDNLQCMIRFKAVAASVKQVNEENYLFGCIAVEDEVRLEFTISYDEFYQVPVFCFRIYVNDRLNFDVVELDTSLKELSHLAMNKIVDISIIDHLGFKFILVRHRRVYTRICQVRIQQQKTATTTPSSHT